jgi:hypothetical protein
MDLTTLIINNKDVSKYLATGSTVSQYDVSKNSGRDVTNARGKMILNVVAQKWRIDIVTKPMTQSEMTDFFSEIIKKPTMTLTFNNPFTGGQATCTAYRGDRSAEYHWAITKDDVLYNGVSMALIEL